MAGDPEQGMQPEHAVEEGLLHVGPGAHIGMVQEYVPIGPDQACADVVDVEEGLSKSGARTIVPFCCRFHFLWT